MKSLKNTVLSPFFFLSLLALLISAPAFATDTFNPKPYGPINFIYTEAWEIAHGDSTFNRLTNGMTNKMPDTKLFNEQMLNDVLASSSQASISDSTHIQVVPHEGYYSFHPRTDKEL